MSGCCSCGSCGFSASATTTTPRTRAAEEVVPDPNRATRGAAAASGFPSTASRPRGVASATGTDPPRRRGGAGERRGGARYPRACAADARRCQRTERASPRAGLCRASSVAVLQVLLAGLLEPLGRAAGGRWLVATGAGSYERLPCFASEPPPLFCDVRSRRSMALVLVRAALAGGRRALLVRGGRAPPRGGPPAAAAPGAGG